ncbi:MAG TPA: deoxyribodipyrimidine photo-lyase, partial [Ramlibacter sp.]|nr:deoxyribodipyrimidine photo-lyase [Ramlibacter sp.]
MQIPYASALMWFRRDLRVQDNAALYHALRSAGQVHCAFVFDTAILRELPRQDRRVEFIRDAVAELDDALRALGGGVTAVHGDAADELPRLAVQLGVQAVFANHDYEPAAIQRDALVRERLAAAGIALHTSKDQVVFERDEILTQADKPYTVFTPYSRAWHARLDGFYLKAYPVERYAARLAAAATDPVPALQDLGFEPTNLREVGILPGGRAAEELLQSFRTRIARYGELRDLPGAKGPSYLSVHLRFGTVSIRRLAAMAHADGSAGAATWLKELAWRDFYFQVLANFPQVGRGESFRPEYDRIAWDAGPEADARFAAWCEGRTGYPLVDAAMLQLNRTGYMHNRLRMVTASFLCKDLGLDWRRGERWFARQLNDYDLAANNGGWQWASSSGCDAQPYFRIFNPVSQGERFDPDGTYVRRWVKELHDVATTYVQRPWDDPAGPPPGYPPPIVDHAEEREEALRRYEVVRAVSSSPRERPRR